MSEPYTDRELAMVAVRVHDIECDHRCAPLPQDFNEARIILREVAPAIAARALRELAEDAHRTRVPVLDGGSSYIDLHARADEIERI